MCRPHTGRQDPRSQSAVLTLLVVLVQLGLDYGATESQPVTNSQFQEDHPNAAPLFRNPLLGHLTTTASSTRPLENEDCLHSLVKPSSPIVHAARSKLLTPMAYNLLSRSQVIYRHSDIPAKFKAPCFSSCALVGSSGALRMMVMKLCYGLTTPRHSGMNVTLAAGQPFV
eukprot:CAMPEP_0117687558 /NCGR_PEP_ID=MMETSP0804-20121206/23212_1 /TAXON_ID=1074897 /ORGANISM="Tetraselmis astigmatica, Strain CCMP880" /LENGTH=169 /DNA_ID=CAMNT_0005499655 /DNA_START=81 /DNA_END=590 /DNA_ORIENTATION=-